MKNLIYIFSILIFILSLNNCTKEETIEKEVLKEPALKLSPDTIIFNDIQGQSIYITSQPMSLIEYQVTSEHNWFSVLPKNGVVNNSIEELNLTPFENLNEGIYTDYIVVESSIGNDSVFVKYVVGENIEYLINDSILFSQASSTEELSFKNIGNVDFTFEISAKNNFISFSQTTGTLAIQDVEELLVTVDKSSLSSGTYFSEIYFKAGNVQDTIFVKIDVLKEQKLHLATNVIDAEYSKESDKVIYVSSNPSKFNIINPSSKSIESISLDYVPTCVSISPNGDKAVVGHDSYISYIDITSMEVSSTINVSEKVHDIVITNNNWAYASINDSYYIQCINLNNNQLYEHIGSSIYYELKIKLHPSGNYIYAAEYDMNKLDISNGTATYLYEQTDYSIDMDHDLWISPDGNRIYTAAGNILSSSEIQSNDMLYSGSFDVGTSYNDKAIWIDFSNINNDMYLILGENYANSTNKYFIKVIDAISMVSKSNIELEKYYVQTENTANVYEAEPYFVFSHSSESKIFVITKAVESGMVNEWGFETIELE